MVQIPDNEAPKSSAISQSSSTNWSPALEVQFFFNPAHAHLWASLWTWHQENRWEHGPPFWSNFKEENEYHWIWGAPYFQTSQIRQDLEMTSSNHHNMFLFFSLGKWGNVYTSTKCNWPISKSSVDPFHHESTLPVSLVSIDHLCTTFRCHLKLQNGRLPRLGPDGPAVPMATRMAHHLRSDTRT